MGSGLDGTRSSSLPNMAGKRRTVKRLKAVKRSSGSPLSPTRIDTLLRSSVPGARELDRKLKGIFELSEAHASLRLK